MTFIKNASDAKEQQKLDEQLKTRSYINGGAEPDSADAETYNLFVKANVKPTKPANVARWFKHIASFSDAERKQWSGASAGGSKDSSPAKDDDFDLFGSDDEEESAEAKRIKEERLAAYAAKKAKKPGVIAKSSVILDIKPWDDETSLDEMEKLVKSIEMDGLLWGASKKVPIGYGISKLQIVCTVEDEKVSVDDLTEKITEFEDHVQSVDIVAFNKI
ncbi:Elongation factor 1 beta [Aphelenchoides bicaudatus]|nr:Elongation factor 1 beta [Aphelenchoides bicaudatus]